MYTKPTGWWTRPWHNNMPLGKKKKCFKTFSSASLPLQNVHIHQHEWHSQHKLSSTLPTDRARRPTLLNYWTLVRTYLALNLLFYFPGVCSPVQQYGSLKAKRHFWTQRNMRTITIWFIESKQFQTLLFGLIFLLFFKSFDIFLLLRRSFTRKVSWRSTIFWDSS